MKKIILLALIAVYMPFLSLADEGMWIPLLLEKYTIEDMQKKGFKLTAEDIYSINNASIKDAVIIFGRGCTGEVVSDQGLILTNHHCGYGAIQSHSSVEHDYLTDGFWAMSKEEELPNPGLSATFLVRIEDVSKKILKGVQDDMTENERSEVVAKNTNETIAEATEGTHYRAIVRPFYYGNEYYMFVYEVFEDVRLVGAPPSAIGKFGGDTDNWMWPRHTGDFSIFRIYANENNQPAEYSPDNVPYEPKKYLPISMKGVELGDFTMVMGYPGSTEQFLHSDAVELISKQRNPHRIKLRDKRLEIMSKYMEENPAVRIQYASKYAGVSNSWKRWQGENRGLKRLNAIERKEKLEKEFSTWLNEKNKRKKEYGGVLNNFEDLYTEMGDYAMAVDYYRESLYAGEIIRVADQILYFLDELEKEEEVPSERFKNYENWLRGFYKDYVKAIDREVFVNLMPKYFKNVEERFHPEIMEVIRNDFDNSFENYVDYLYRETALVDSSVMLGLLRTENVNGLLELKADPVLKFSKAFGDVYEESVQPRYYAINDQLDSLYRIYVRGLRQMQEDKVFYPDANFTMRVAYGVVKRYEPRDGVIYKHYTTLEGVMEKDNPEIYDYDVPDKLKELYENKDYGRYEVDGTVPVCFIGSNHTSGGNSGSPVINADGHLIGINFDRNWEGTMSDIMYDPDQCRNITIDIRYLLFIVDKFAGAGHLVEEMTLITE